MRIAPLYAQPEPTISFEFFPPKSAEGEAILFRDVVPALKCLNPAFMTVTYGAGGGTKSSTLRIVSTLLRDHGGNLRCVIGAWGQHRSEPTPVGERLGRIVGLHRRSCGERQRLPVLRIDGQCALDQRERLAGEAPALRHPQGVGVIGEQIGVVGRGGKPGRDHVVREAG